MIKEYTGREVCFLPVSSHRFIPPCDDGDGDGGSAADVTCGSGGGRRYTKTDYASINRRFGGIRKEKMGRRHQ